MSIFDSSRQPSHYGEHRGIPNEVRHPGLLREVGSKILSHVIEPTTINTSDERSLQDSETTHPPEIMRPRHETYDEINARLRSQEQ